MTKDELISKQAVLDALLAKMDTIDDKPKVVLGLAVAAGMIKDMPSALEQEPCDAVGRKAAIDACLKGLNRKEMVSNIKALSPVAPAEKVAHWIVHPKGIYAHLVCSNCLSGAPYDCKTNYCPNCGAKMQASPTGAEGNEE